MPADRVGARSRSTGATASGVNGCASASTASSPSRSSASRPGATRPSSNRTWTSANSSEGVGARADRSGARRRPRRCALRRGSTTTSLPPRAWSARSRPRMSGAVISEPLEASGFAPRISRCVGAVDVGDRDRQRRRRTSAPQAICFGRWSTVLAREDVARAERLDQHAAVEQRREAVGGGVADVDGDGVAAVLGARSAAGGRSIAPNASSQLAGRELAVAPRTSGVRRRSGSSWRSLSATPFGQRKPCEKTSSASPRTLTTSSPRTVDLEAAGRLAERARPERGALHQAEPTPSGPDDRAAPSPPSARPRRRRG